ncbi:Phytoene dehydrogenase-related protein [Archaeoglobus sulfaticallidus PM70-1]|uniref:Phytoene dehydrogenase-related protein n=1 Tax=Archaeoglobus sulfaticallidus PM70-1 TaxID=387631 RepID=N0BE32_9EURY|nr:NAD(P)/FAD-dependent oxidoreductase [Archaeoglobus sulfaticallidus]AGK61884.1 Phytoene dehydrogenase-related protein [Archaeoglobus sulfaticallidus PM70-1]
MKGNVKNNRKIPGMLYILISFVPWVVYWVLCGMGNMLGVVIPLVIILLLIIPQICRRDFNLMDVTSLLYFSIATTATFIFNLNIFVEKSGFLGYFTLFLMALFSLIIKQPYTLQVSKRDYPEIYWKEKSFLAINNIITGVWAVIFIANATIFLLLDIPFTIILSNTLIALGIAFSIVFPLKAPAYFASKEFKKYDWSVEVTQKLKGENEYDVIIVGSGIAGLTCGALLSKRGYKVLVLEQHYQVGGYCSSFKRRDFVFNAGVSDVSGLWEKGPIAYLLRELGLKREDLFVRNTIRYVFKDEEVEVQNLEEFMRKLSDMFPEEKENIYAFFDEAKKAYEECYKDAEAYGIPLPAELIVKVFGAKKLLDYPKEHPHFYDWMNKTFRQKLDEYFKNEDLKTLLGALLGYIGTEADKTPASNALTAVVSYYIHGGYFPRGGAQRFANSLKEVIEGHGGKVLLRHKADKILIGNGKVEGIKVGDKVFRASIVVANANAKTTFLELVGEKHLDARFIEYLKTLKMSPSCFAVFLGVDADLTEYPTIVVDLDDGYYVVINSNADSSLAPNGKASVTILTLANYHDFPERGTEEYLQKKKEFAEMLIKKAEKVIPDLSKRIIVQDAATPKTFERYTSMPEGAIYAFDQSIDTKRPYFKTPIRGLYLASASTFPGGGIEAVVISGMICANDICNWEVKQ